jgi:hypothetical protein
MDTLSWGTKSPPLASGGTSVPGCPASLPDEDFFGKPFRDVNNRYDPDALFYSLPVGILIHIPGIFIHILSERSIHIPRIPHFDSAPRNALTVNR